MAKKKFQNTGSGPSQRQLRVGELIRRRLSEVLAQGEIHDPELNRISITVAEVRASPDLKNAIAFVMPLGGLNAPEALEALNRNRGELRHALSKGMSLKHTPQLRFILDDTFDRMDETRRLFSQEDVQRDIAATNEDDDET